MSENLSQDQLRDAIQHYDEARTACEAERVRLQTWCAAEAAAALTRRERDAARVEVGEWKLICEGNDLEIGRLQAEVVRLREDCRAKVVKAAENASDDADREIERLRALCAEVAGLWPELVRCTCKRCRTVKERLAAAGRGEVTG